MNYFYNYEDVESLPSIEKIKKGNKQHKEIKRVRGKSKPKGFKHNRKESKYNKMP